VIIIKDPRVRKISIEFHCWKNKHKDKFQEEFQKSIFVEELYFDNTIVLIIGFRQRSVLLRWQIGLRLPLNQIQFAETKLCG